MKDDIIFVSINKKEGVVFISEDSTSGAEYKL